jgi:hypothetical protein
MVCVIKPLLAVAGIAAVGMGGYNFATTGCPLGRCESGAASGVTALVDLGSENAGCSLGGCSEDKGQHEALLLTSNATPAHAAASHGACPGMEASHCAEGGAGDALGCPTSADACEDMDPAECEKLCETECPHAVPAGDVAGAEGSEQPGAGEG